MSAGADCAQAKSPSASKAAAILGAISRTLSKPDATDEVLTPLSASKVGSKAGSQEKVATESFSEDLVADLREDYPMLCFDELEDHCVSTRSGHQGRIPGWKMAVFGLPFLGWYAMFYMKNTTMKVFYTDDYPKASLGYIALFSTLGVIMDAFTDPMMASWTDNARPALWGRRRPFIMLGGFMALVVFTFSYTPVVPSGVAASIWYGFFHIGAKLADTVLIIPLDAWGAEMTPAAAERSSLWMFREIFTVLGILCGAVIPGLTGSLGGVDCTESPASGCLGFPVLSFTFGCICLLACMLLVRVGKERPNARLPEPPKKAAWSENSVVATLIGTWLNQPFRCLVVSNVVEAFGGTLPFAVLPFFTKGVLGDACMKPSMIFSVLAGVNLITRIMFLPLWVWAGKRYGKFGTFLSFNFLLAASHCIFFFIQRDTEECGQMKLSIAAAAIWGIVYSGSFFLRSIMSDVIDYDEFLTGKRREGQYMMTVDFLPKFLQVPAEALPFLLLAYFGYKRPSEDNAAPEQPVAVVWLLRLCFSLIPAAFIFASGLVLCRYPREARSSQSHKDLMVAIRSKHAKGLPASDPWFPGRIVEPPPAPGPNGDILAHFWPSELLSAVSGAAPDYVILLTRTLRGIGLGLFLCPFGVILMVVGWHDMGSDLGASVSPIGLVLLGVAMLLVWFDGTRFLAARHVQQRAVPRDELVARYNFLCRFTGADRFRDSSDLREDGESFPCALVEYTIEEAAL